MACPDENELLDFLSQQLDARADARIREHLETCERCRQTLAAAPEATDDPGATTASISGEPGKTVVPGASEPTLPGVRPLGGVDSLLGAQVGEYLVEERVGEGGMGIVYRARHPLIGKTVAIKVLKPEVAAEAHHVRRMLEEARTVNAVADRRVVDVFGFGSLDDGRHYMVMEYLSGTPVNVALRRGLLTRAEKVELLGEILDGLEVIHRAGVVHRDLKPSNLFLVAQDDGTRTLKLLDFGLAKLVSPTPDGLTRSRFMLGTPAYMAPEQVRGQPVSARTDLYAFGVIAFELFTGRRPFVDSNLARLVKQQVESPPPVPSSLERSLPKGFDALVLSLLAKEPTARPASAEAVRALLAPLAPELRAGRPRFPWKPVAMGVGVAAGLLLGLGGWYAMQAPVLPKLEAPKPDEPKVVVVEPQPKQVEPAAEPAPEPPKPEPAPVDPPEPKERPRPRPTTSWRDDQLGRIGKLRKRLKRPDPTVTMLLDEAESQVKQAKSDEARSTARRSVDDIERYYFK